jgi:hypothetical protein
MATTLDNINYTLIKKNKWGRLNQDVFIETGITGHEASIMNSGIYCHLQPDGMMWIGTGTEWDFGSGPAINTPAMVRASLVHDMFCHLTDRGLVPWNVRSKADKLFRQHLIDYNPKRRWFNPLRYWHNARYAGVVMYSQCLARFKRHTS